MTKGFHGLYWLVQVTEIVVNLQLYHRVPNCIILGYGDWSKNLRLVILWKVDFAKASVDIYTLRHWMINISLAYPGHFLNNVTMSHITVYPKKYAHGFVVLCFVVVMQSFIMNSHEVFIHIYQGCFAGTGAIVRLPQCQWSKPDGYGKISQCITTTKHSKAKTVCIFCGIYCTSKSVI